jgi:hypothetical protein
VEEKMKWLSRFKAIPKKIIGVTLLLVVAIWGCSTTAIGDVPMQVELDVFSGRPNPYWNLTPQEANEFISLLQALPQTQAQGAVKEGLGYRGLIVTDPDQTIAGYDQIVISNGVVVARRDSQLRQFPDKERRLERWLFQTGRGRLDVELYRQVGQAAQLE